MEQENRFEYISYKIIDDKLIKLGVYDDLVKGLNSLCNYYRNPLTQGLLRAKDLVTSLTTIIYVTPPPSRYPKLSGKKDLFFLGEQIDVGNYLKVPQSFSSIKNNVTIKKGNYLIVNRTRNKVVVLTKSSGYVSDCNISWKYLNAGDGGYNKIYIQKEVTLLKKDFPVLFIDPTK